MAAAAGGMHDAPARRGAPADLARSAASRTTRRLGPPPLCDGALAVQDDQTLRASDIELLATRAVATPRPRWQRLHATGLLTRAAFLHHGRRRVRRNCDVAPLPALPRCRAFRRGRPARAVRRRASAGCCPRSRRGCAMAADRQTNANGDMLTHLDFPRKSADARRIVHRHPGAVCAGRHDYRAGAARRGTAHRSSCALPRPRREPPPRRRRTPLGEPVA